MKFKKHLALLVMTCLLMSMPMVSYAAPSLEAVCPIDGCLEYLDWAYLGEHLLERHNMCPWCRETFSTDVLTQHAEHCPEYQSCWGSDGCRVPDVCDICGLNICQGQLSLHKAVAHNPADVPCEFCWDVFTPATIEKHVMTTHLDDIEDPFVCPICNSLTSYSYMPEHMKAHDDTDEFDCPFCGETFTVGTTNHLDNCKAKDDNAITEEDEVEIPIETVVKSSYSVILPTDINFNTDASGLSYASYALKVKATLAPNEVLGVVPQRLTLVNGADHHISARAKITQPIAFSNYKISSDVIPAEDIMVIETGEECSIFGAITANLAVPGTYYGDLVFRIFTGTIYDNEKGGSEEK